MPRTYTNLWFDRQGEDAAAFYCSVFPNSKVLEVARYPEGTDRAGEVITIDVELDGVRYTLLNGGPEFTFTEAISIIVECQDQAEIDHYWDALLAGGGEPGPCGWLKDRFGLSWQIIPAGWTDLMRADDPPAYARAMGAMMQMHKLDIAALQAAAAG